MSSLISQHCSGLISQLCSHLGSHLTSKQDFEVDVEEDEDEDDEAHFSHVLEEEDELHFSQRIFCCLYMIEKNNFLKKLFIIILLIKL